MKDDDDKNTFLSHTKNILDKGMDEIDSSTLLQLRKIRAKALAGTSDYNLWFSPRFSLAATAAISVLAMTLWFAQPPAQTDAFVFEDMQLLSANEDLDFYQQLEFYDWLGNQKYEG